MVPIISNASAPIHSCLLYGGSSVAGDYRSDLLTVDLESGLLTTIEPLHNTVNDHSAPFARRAAGLVPLTSISTEEGLKFLLYGGRGASDGVIRSETDADWGDSWILTLTRDSRETWKYDWSRADNQRCVQNGTVCMQTNPTSCTSVCTRWQLSASPDTQPNLRSEGHAMVQFEQQVFVFG